MYHKAIILAWATPHALTWPIIHCLAYLLQIKSFRTFNRHDPKLDLIDIKSQQRNHSLTVVTHYEKATFYNNTSNLDLSIM